MIKLSKKHEPFPCESKEVYSLLVNGLAAKIRSTGLKDVVIGVSGGLDSALCLIVATAAFEKLKLPKKGIHAYTMPCFGTSARTKSNANELCQELGIGIETIDIRKSCRQHLKDIGHDMKTADVTYENAQARMRTMVLFDKANMLNALVLGTGDMSEIALGWCTFGGDALSHFGVNAGVPKTVIRKICSWWAAKHGSKTMVDIVVTPVSPELIKGQVTEDKIGPYELHDFFLWNYLKNSLGPHALVSLAIEKFGDKYEPITILKTLDTFYQRYHTQAFKRETMPPSIKVFPIEFK